MKKLFKVLLVLLVLFIGAVVAFFYFIDTIVKKGIEEGGSYALGVPTTLQSADIGFLAGTFSLTGLDVANPPGFGAAHFMSLGSGGVAVSAASLNSPTIELPEFKLDALEVNLQRKDGNANYKVILGNLEKLGGGGPQPASSGEKKFIVKHLAITNVKINVDLLGVSLPGSGGGSNIVVPIDKIELTNIGQTGEGIAGSGVTIGQLSAIIVSAVLSAASANGAGIIPEEILGDLNRSLEGLSSKLGPQLGDLEAMGMKVGDKALADLEKDVSDSLKQKANDAIKDATKGLEGLIPGKK